MQRLHFMAHCWPSFSISAAAAGWIALLFIIFGGTVISYWMYLQSLKHITPTMAGLLDTLEPLTATFGTVVFMNVFFNAAQYIGAALILGTVFILALGHPLQEPTGHCHHSLES